MASPAANLTDREATHAAASSSAFARLAWGVLAYTVFVVLFGAVVRITGSGAGCGQHWPTCQGDVFTVPHGMKMAIEYSHRATSALSVVLVTGLVAAAFRRFPAGHDVRRWATASAIAILVEALIGAVLVKRALVADNVSVARAVVISLHLVNTSFLTGSIALAAFSASHERRRFWPTCGLDWTLLGALALTLTVAVSGAVTALGDTLFPVDVSRSLPARLAADYSVLANPLEKGRAIHPVLAILTALFLIVLARKTADIRPRPTVERGARWLTGLVVLQAGVGFGNIALGAPGYMQVAHLGVANAVWIALVVFYATALSSRNARLEPEPCARV